LPGNPKNECNNPKNEQIIQGLVYRLRQYYPASQGFELFMPKPISLPVPSHPYPIPIPVLSHHSGVLVALIHIPFSKILSILPAFFPFRPEKCKIFG